MTAATGRAVAQGPGQQRTQERQRAHGQTQAQQTQAQQRTQALQHTDERQETRERRQHARVRLMGTTQVYGLLVRIGRAWFRGWTLYVASIRER